MKYIWAPDPQGRSPEKTPAPERDERPASDWYVPLAAHLQEAYLRYSFTIGTEQEVDFLTEELGLAPGMRLLDVGCGPGRHAVSLAGRGLDVVGVDISPDFVRLARRRAAEAGARVSFFEGDAENLPFEDEFDAVVSLCEGAFGLGLDDLRILRGMTRALRSGRLLAVGAPNVFHVVRHLDGGACLDPVRMVYREVVEGVIGADGTTRDFEMWSTCFTPREMEWIANGAGLDPVAVYGVEPGAYRGEPPSLDHPELLLVARKP